MICVNFENQCPITKIHLSFSDENKLELGQEKLLLNLKDEPARRDEKWIHLSWTKQGKNLPITSTKISPSTPCFTPNEVEQNDK
jgi:hypothetical protein